MEPSNLSRKNKKRVLVAMSGGVDSSVAAFLLKKEGYEVVGVTMCFGLEDSKGRRPSCCSISGIEDARRVAQHLGINHYVLSFGKQLKEKVISEFVKEYLSGRTPNPCIRCNQYLKFDELVKRAKQMNCDYLATGHYARLVQDKKMQHRLTQIKNIQINTDEKMQIGADEKMQHRLAQMSTTKSPQGVGDPPKHYGGIGGSANYFGGEKYKISTDKEMQGQFFLKRAKDTKKDQSYFLFRMPKDKMDFVLFPLGDYTKTEVRKIARENKLRVADKPGSQEICFVGTDYHRFLKHRLSQMKIEIKPGPIVDMEGKVLGQHKGICFYTVGQRQGLGIAYKCPLYVVKIDNKTNTLIVGEKKDVYGSRLIGKEVHLLSVKSLPKELEVKAKIRYNHPKAKAIIRPLKNNKVSLEFFKPQWAITPGQSVVFYKNNTVIGGATIK